MKKQKNPKSLKFLLASIFLVLTVSFANAQDQVVIDKIIGKVDNYIILKSDLEKTYLNYLSRGEINSGNLRCQILESLVINKMLVAKAEIDSVEISEEEVNSESERKMATILAQIGGSEEDLEKFYGKSMEQIQTELYDDMREQVTIRKMRSEISTDLKVTPAEVKRFFNAIPRDSLPYFSTEVSVSQIVILPEPGKRQLERVERQLLEIRGSILRGESFAEFARLYSEDPGSAARGGELPFYKRGELAPEFEAAAMTMQPGEMSMPVRTQFGYHLIELQEKRGNTFKSRHILIMPKPSQEDISAAEKKADSIRMLVVNDSMTFRNAAKEFSDDKYTSQSGGYFTDEEGNNRIPVEMLDPNVFFTIDTMQVGTISKPLRYIEMDGSVAFRILYYESKVRPHLANLKDDYQKIANAALNQKTNIKLGEWFEEARKEVYIEIDPEFSGCRILED